MLEACAELVDVWGGEPLGRALAKALASKVNANMLIEDILGCSLFFERLVERGNCLLISEIVLIGLAYDVKFLCNH